MIKNPHDSAGDIRHIQETGDTGSILGLRSSPRGGHGNPLQYSFLENPRDRGAWWATVYRIAKSRIRLKQLSMYAYTSLTLATTVWFSISMAVPFNTVI